MDSIKMDFVGMKYLFGSAAAKKLHTYEGTVRYITSH